MNFIEIYFGPDIMTYTLGTRCYKEYIVIIEIIKHYYHSSGVDMMAPYPLSVSVTFDIFPFSPYITI